MTRREEIETQAVDWLVRTYDPEFADWDDFTAWLERDPAHGDAYHALADGEALLRDHVRVPAGVAVTGDAAAFASPGPRFRSARRWGAVGGTGIAAALAIAVMLPSAAIQVATAPGEIRTIELGQGDTLTVNGDTALHLASDRRTIELERGQIFLALDAGAEPVRVTMDDLSVVDVGTRFDVTRDEAGVRVLVTEGAVRARQGRASRLVGAGERLDVAGGAMRVSDGGAGAGAGSWREGELTYEDEPLATVARDLARAGGIDISLESAIGERRFTGTLIVADVRDDPESLGGLLGVRVEQDGRGWRLKEGH